VYKTADCELQTENAFRERCQTFFLILKIEPLKRGANEGGVVVCTPYPINVLNYMLIPTF